MPEGSAVGAQLVGRHPRRREALFAEQLAHQLDGRRPVATTLDQDLEDLALVVDGTPQIHVLRARKRACQPPINYYYYCGFGGVAFETCIAICHEPASLTAVTPACPLGPLGNMKSR